MTKLLIVRREDMVHIGVNWGDGFELYMQDDMYYGDIPMLYANEDAEFTLSFPPQVIEEQVWPRGRWPLNPWTYIPKQRSGISRVKFAVPARTYIELTVQGILGALTDLEVIYPPMVLQETAIELPWKLIVRPVTKSGNGIVVSEHPVLPVKSSKGVTGLWHTRLRASDGDKEDAALSLLPLKSIPGDMVDHYNHGYTPLPQVDREKIVTNSLRYPHKLPYSKRLELSTLGGTLSATVKWPDFEWDHEVVLGRDQKVRTLATGVLFPFGHKARVETFIERDFINENPSQGTDTGLVYNGRLVITEPVRGAVDDPILTREFPFDKIEILSNSFQIDPCAGGDLFIPHAVGCKPLYFPIRLTGSNGDVFFNVPLVFVRGDLSAKLQQAKDLWDRYRTIDLPGVPIDMIRDNRRSGNVQDIYEVQELCMDIDLHAGKLIPKVERFTVELPALRELQPHKFISPISLKFTQTFLDGVNEDLAFEPFNKIDKIHIDFTDRPNCSGGLLAPRFSANKISRTSGPIPVYDNLPLSEIYSGATLLGLPLESLIKQVDPPKIIQEPGNPLGATMEWSNLILKDFGPFKTDETTSATLKVERSEVFCEVKNFTFVLPLNLVSLKFGSLAFTQKPNCAPDLEITDPGIKFDRELNLLKGLLDCMLELLPSNKPTVIPTAEGINASYSFGLPSVNAGMFLLRNAAVYFGINVPFSSNPVTMTLAFGRRDNPFNLSVMMFGGGGHIEVEFGGDKLRRLEASMEFGAMVAIDFIVASAEVHALGGVRFLTTGNNIELDASIRLGGSIEVLGLVSVSIELTVKLNYDEKRNSLYGSAKLVIEVDLTLFSESVTIDSGKWELIGSDKRNRRRMLPLSTEEIDNRLKDFMNYYKAFEPV